MAKINSANDTNSNQRGHLQDDLAAKDGLADREELAMHMRSTKDSTKTEIYEELVGTLHLLAQSVEAKMRYERIIEELLQQSASPDAPIGFATKARQIVRETKAPVSLTIVTDTLQR